ncbi:MAG: class I SAM-dependent methyltransferase [Gemmatimonadales bacterium]|jgi:SAM-dependent methyltransferase|nr:MAG: class I SAM-dependent methyltransferase [Gemmatimonadales bacterium]
MSLARRVRDKLRGPGFHLVRRAVLLGRGLLFLGRRYRCPCCGWSLRSFTGPWSILASNPDGYCPRCNAKARHRRLWLFLEERTGLLSADATRLLEVAPWWAMSRRLMGAPNVSFVGLDLQRTGPHVTVVGDATRIPLQSGSVDATLCIHTLEHIEDDRAAMGELHRVLRPGGWAVVSVPLDLDAPTFEDPSITDPEERLRSFGERGHVRAYGLDIRDRLEAAGFSVQLDRAADVPGEVRARFGLRVDENIFFCRKATGG